ncbi:MAG TPA: hypothetical protein VMW06_10990 [Desulfobacterales bacterium]|nr:hypothetical protein [Desulfobacterales bacterium]
MPLDQYLKSFSSLRTDKNRKRWSALTTYQAPHKSFLLLSIMDLIAQGFRKAIITLFSHWCALCRIRMLTPEGHTIVDAAHVRPWKESFWPAQNNLYWHRQNRFRR